MPIIHGKDSNTKISPAFISPPVDTLEIVALDVFEDPGAVTQVL